MGGSGDKGSLPPEALVSEVDGQSLKHLVWGSTVKAPVFCLSPLRVTEDCKELWVRRERR